MPRSVAPLVGRSAELATLLGAVEHAAQGTASAVVVDGDAGVGKTRLLSELVTEARRRDALVLIGHCVDLGDAPPPYLPFIEAFGRYAAEYPTDVDNIVSAFPAIGRLLRRQPGDSHAPEDRVDRGDLFESVLAGLATPALDCTVLLIVEDVHWADQATRDLLGFLFTRLDRQRVCVVVTYRSDDLHRRHPLRPTLAEWSRLTRVERLHLDPLAPADVRSLVSTLFNRPMPEMDLRSIVTRADGNAFFAEELVAAAEQCHDAQQLPWQLADLLLVRLDRLSPEAREVVRVAAVGGRRVSHEMLAAVLELPPHMLDGALRDAVDAHILEPTPSGRGYTFRHALLAEAIYDDLLPGERSRIHAAYAAALETADDGSSAELARHARASHDLPTAYEASIRAGDEAMSLAAPQEALNHYQMALELASQVGASDNPAPLVSKLVDAAIDAGRSYRGLRLARAALQALDADTSPLTRAELLYAFASAALAGEADEATVSATGEAVRLVPSDPPTPFRARLVALHARGLLIMGREVDSERWAREAVDIADKLGMPTASGDAEVTLALLSRRADSPDESADRLVALAEGYRAAGQTAAELRTRYNLGSLYYEHGDLERAETAYLAAVQRARDVGRPWTAFGMEARAMAGLCQFSRGNWDDAMRTLDVSGESAPPLTEALYAATAMAVRAGRGDPNVLELLDPLRESWKHESRIPLYAIGAAIEALEPEGRADEAIALLGELVSVLSVMWQNEWFLARIRLSAQTLAVLCVAAVTAPQARRAELVEAGRVLYADGHTSLELGMPSGRKLGSEGEAWVARLEAEWARLRWLCDVDAPTEGEHVALWRRAVEAFHTEAVHELARSKARLAAVLRAAGDAREAAQHAEAAVVVARRLGALPLVAEVEALGLGVGGGRSAPSDALTGREREVLGLLIEGRTNRQIGRQLYISEKTVSVHVSNILAKLGVGSRTEAAALARREGLLAQVAD